ncbi:MAG: GTP-binding protein [Hormoscilla sp. GUM202]|nr:GTP-binding protein [Hormoscilla sp. GUM202]
MMGKNKSGDGLAQGVHLNQARASIRQALSQYGHRHMRSLPVQPELDLLKSVLDKLDNTVIRIAVFGLVSRGKSAVLNALLGEKILQTGPIHGVTQWPRSVRWTDGGGGRVQVELIDTPGLDEIAGQVRSDMAQQVAQQSDLILFVVAGDITRTEYDALLELQQAQKPLILVFNKIDLYPEQDLEAIYRKLQQLGGVWSMPCPSGQEHAEDAGGTGGNLLTRNEIVRVAAAPMSRQVRVELPDGTVSYEWETPPSQVDELRQKIIDLLNREGRSLLALNALVQAREAETSIARKTVEYRSEQGEELIWKFARYKAIAVAVNPIALLDIMGGAVTDLALIRELGKLYNLPMTNYTASKLWKTIVFSSGGLMLGELGSSLLFGLGKTTAAVTGATAITAFGGAAIAQACLAGYGAYKVGTAAQVYLEQGCTWGPLGANTVIKSILDRVDSNTILYRLRQELFH